MDLIPPDYVIARYLAEQKAKLDELIAVQEAASQEVEEYVGDHAVEDGLLWEAVVNDKISKTTATARLRDAEREPAEAEEIQALQHVIKLYEMDAKAKSAVKTATLKLNEQALAQYGQFSLDDIQALVVDDKWGGAIRARVDGEVTVLGQELIARLRVLSNRYEATVGELDAEIDELGARVAEHLAAMGIE